MESNIFEHKANGTISASQSPFKKASLPLEKLFPNVFNVVLLHLFNYYQMQIGTNLKYSF